MHSQERQTIAFKIIVKVIINPDSDQLLMYLGGTGKSEVIKAITEMFQILNKLERLRKKKQPSLEQQRVTLIVLR